MAWLPVNQFAVGEGRIDAILIPSLLSSPHVAIKVTDVKRRKWRKAGDLFQQFTGGVRGQDIFVPFSEQRALDMQTTFGDYYLRFQPVSYHQGLLVELWQWVLNTYSLFSDIDIPISINDEASYELGVKIRFAEAGQITALKFFKPIGETGSHTGKIWSISGDLLYSIDFVDESVAGWQTQIIEPFAVADSIYVISVNSNLVYPASPYGLDSSIVNGAISSEVGDNGVFNTSVNAYPDTSYNNTNYYRDIVFQTN